MTVSTSAGKASQCLASGDCPSPWKCAPGLLVPAWPGATHRAQQHRQAGPGPPSFPPAAGLAPVFSMWLRFHSGFSWVPAPPLFTLTMTGCPGTAHDQSCALCSHLSGPCPVSWSTLLVFLSSRLPPRRLCEVTPRAWANSPPVPSLAPGPRWPSAASRLPAAACRQRALCVSSGPHLAPELLLSWSPAYMSHPELLKSISTQTPLQPIL